MDRCNKVYHRQYYSHCYTNSLGTHPLRMTRTQKQFPHTWSQTQISSSHNIILTENPDTDSFPSSPVPNSKINKVAYITIDKKEGCTAYTDIKEKLPQKSSWGNQYILIGYHYDVNCILAEPMCNRTSTLIKNTWSKIHYIFSQVGAATCAYVMDNEIFNKFIQSLRQQQTSYQLVTPHTHHRNIAECAKQTLKIDLKGAFPVLTTQQHNIQYQAWCTVYDGWHERLFPRHAHGASRVYEGSQQTHPGRHNAQILLTQQIHLIWICLHLHLKGHIRPKIGHHPAYEHIKKSWLCMDILLSSAQFG